MSFTQDCNQIFNKVINDYHLTDNIDTPINNPYDRDSIENRLYLKCWIDTVQWHYEDIIRDPHIDPIEALQLKRRIDRSNQDRTDLVEQIDSYFRQKFCDVTHFPTHVLTRKVLHGQLTVCRYLPSRFITCASR